MTTPKKNSQMMKIILIVTVFLNSTAGRSEDLPKRYILFSDNANKLAEKMKGRNLHQVKHLAHSKAVVLVGDLNEVQRLANDMNARVEEDHVYSIPRSEISGKPSGGSTQPPPQVIPWGISKIRAREASNRGLGIKVCVSDTGIDLNHADLKANIISNFNTISPTKSGMDDNGHGTHVAGVIAAIDNTIGVVGVAPQASLIAAKGLGRSGSGYSTDLAETIDGCVLRGAKIISMSWGSASASSIIQEALERARNAGVLLIAAAGNEAGPVGYPAAFEGVVAVSATDVNDNFASFSNFGPQVFISAPGVQIFSTYKSGTYATLSGTSMATPFVSGVAALMLNALPGSTNNGLRGIDIGLSIERQGVQGRLDAILSTTP